MRRTPSLILLTAMVVVASACASSATFRGSPWIDGYRIGDVAREADAISEGLPQSQQVHDFLDLLHGAARLGD